MSRSPTWCCHLGQTQKPGRLHHTRLRRVSGAARQVRGPQSKIGDHGRSHSLPARSGAAPTPGCPTPTKRGRPRHTVSKRQVMQRSWWAGATCVVRFDSGM